MDLWTSLPLAIWTIAALLLYLAVIETLSLKTLVQIRDAQPTQDQQALANIHADLAGLYTLILQLKHDNKTQPLEEQTTKVLPAFKG